MARSPDDDSFLGRWSRRKRQTEASTDSSSPDAGPAPPETAGTELPAPPAPPPDTISDEELAALPRVDELVPGSDIRGFLRPGVPPALKNAALRRIWMLTPAIRDHADPAVDYAWDWNTPGGVPGDGLAPSAEASATMLRNLVSPPRAEPKAPAGDETAPPADIGAAQAPGEVSAARQEADRVAAPGTDSTAMADSTSTPDPAEPEPEIPDMPTRHRHGGAMPG